MPSAPPGPDGGRSDLTLFEPEVSIMDTKEAYADRLEASMRVADARLDQMEAQARARNAKAEMDEISGLRARRDKIQQLVAAAKKEAGDDWQAFQSRVQANGAD